MTGDSMEHQQQHAHYHHHHHHLHHHQHHRHHNNNDNDDDKDDEDDDRLSGAGDDYDHDQAESDSSSYASRALRHFTARAAASVHDGDVRARTDWPPPPPAGSAPDNHLLYTASATSAANMHDDISFAGNCNQNHVLLASHYSSYSNCPSFAAVFFTGHSLCMPDCAALLAEYLLQVRP